MWVKVTAIYTLDDTLAQYRDTLIGRFNGIDIDTLICEPIDSLSSKEDDLFGGKHYKWRVYTTNGTVKDLIVGNTISIDFIKEGDIDGNGTDEFGVRRESETGTWDNYYIYTFDSGEWKYLTEPIRTYSTHFYDNLSNGNNVAEKTDDCGLIRIRFSDVRNDDFLITDTLIRTNPLKKINRI